MQNSSNGSVAGKGDVWLLIAQAVLPYLLHELQVQGLPTATYYHQGDNPLGRRRYLSLVRRGVLQGRREGRKVFVLRSELDAYIAAQPRVTPNTEATVDPLEEWGLRRRRR